MAAVKDRGVGDECSLIGDSGEEERGRRLACLALCRSVEKWKSGISRDQPVVLVYAFRHFTEVMKIHSSLNPYTASAICIHRNTFSCTRCLVCLWFSLRNGVQSLRDVLILSAPAHPASHLTNGTTLYGCRHRYRALRRQPFTRSTMPPRR